MCRNETQEKQYDSCYSGDEKQEAIDNPEIRFATPFYERDSQHDQEKGPTADKWRKETRVRSFFIGKPVYQCFGLTYQFFPGTVCAGNGCSAERFFQVGR